MIKTFVFDFNGTMFFDAEIQYESWRQFLLTTFNKTMTMNDFQQHIAGRNNHHTFNYFANKDLNDDDIRRLSAAKEKIYRQLCLDQPDKFHLVSGLAAFLDKAVASDRRVNIATASEKGNVQFFFKHLHLDKWFNPELVVINDGTLPGKPAPDMFLKAIRQVGGVPESAAVFEDSPSGIQAANNGKVAQTVLVVDPNFSRPNFKDETRIDQEVTTYADVLNVNSLWS